MNREEISKLVIEAIADHSKLTEVIDKLYEAQLNKKGCKSCGKNEPEVCDSCLSDIVQATGEQARNSR